MAKPGFAQALPPSESIQGTVINSVTHEPIGRVLVFSPDNRFAAMTDGEGHFAFTFPAASSAEDNSGFYSSGSQASTRAPGRPNELMAKKPGFLPNRHRISSLRADPKLTISLTPEAVISGRVIVPSAGDSDRIRVQLYQQYVQGGQARWTPGAMVTTRSNGEFRFSELSPGTYKILTRELLDRDPLTFDPHGQLYGYPPVYFPNAEDFASAQAIQLSAGQTFEAEISVVRKAYYPVKVAVENVASGTLMNLNVSAQGRGPGYELGYDRKEHAIVGMLPDGNYTLEVSTFEANAATGLLNLTVKGAPVEGPRVVVVPNASITVVVTEEFTSSDRSGRNPGSQETSEGPNGYLNIHLEPADDILDPRREAAVVRAEHSAAQRRDRGLEDKSLVLENVPPGRYWMRIDSLRGFPALVTCGGVDLEQQPLTIGAGGSNTAIEVTMRDDGAEVQGTVEGLAKTAANTEGSAVLYLVPMADGGGDFRQAGVSPEGKFSLQQVPPGLYRVLAFDQPQPILEYRNAEAMRAYESKGQVIRLAAGQKQQLQIQVISTSE